MSENGSYTDTDVSDTSSEDKIGKWAIRILYILHTLFYLPITYLIVPGMGLVLLLRCFYIPLIATVVLSFFYIRMLRKQDLITAEVLLFAVMLVINIIDLVILEFFFSASMSV